MSRVHLGHYIQCHTCIAHPLICIPIILLLLLLQCIVLHLQQQQSISMVNNSQAINGKRLLNKKQAPGHSWTWQKTCVFFGQWLHRAFPLLKQAEIDECRQHKTQNCINNAQKSINCCYYAQLTTHCMVYYAIYRPCNSSQRMIVQY